MWNNFNYILFRCKRGLDQIYFIPLCVFLTQPLSVLFFIIIMCQIVVINITKTTNAFYIYKGAELAGYIYIYIYILLEQE